ncbi:hypothetical protein [Salidesulfovibrio brasiliensis]|uniref:hypothetical protein n=1 Tax=Salidesulfovibrio brasiliensis TaxID=221711 RepID=UPI000A6FC66F|nr:hypothetical protein [Salidesulfovibrio brasiliensis]
MSQRQGRIAVFFTGGTIGMSPAEGVDGVAPGNNFSKLLHELASPPDAWCSIPCSGLTSPART